jgi:hypothetical protein
MTVDQLSKHEQRLVMHTIRQFGTGGHPLPDELNVVFFTPQYVSQCLHQALKVAILDVQERKQLTEIIIKLSD